MEMLLEYGADIHAVDQESQTALHIAARHGSLAAVEFLLRHININKADESGYTPLMKAAINGEEDVVRLLVRKKADVRHMSNSGYTALDVARIGDDEEEEGEIYQRIGGVLIRAGADIEGHEGLLGLLDTLVDEVETEDRDVVSCKTEVGIHPLFYMGNVLTFLFLS